ncbi:hypothetical protein C798_08015 [Herbaspirillum rubrisubalbicans Os34]|uniref:Uncharacterized protein n=1 Tax=Herbaspirillum rubrisubalbicans Os34 TaxID=1235827 RepID=A0A6M3ZNG4_9BURK|nr:hypothetical protein [Herbaspirillum rubrisubalbicans]QJQ00178.1 hypothetical protein C798_08015 [Herbaspirillum rubrisubalbicans Os34]
MAIIRPVSAIAMERQHWGSIFNRDNKKNLIMDITFRAAWRMPLGFSLNLDSLPIVVHSEDGKKFTLANEPVDDFFSEIDKGRALWELHTEVLESHEELTYAEYKSRLDTYISLLRKDRLIQHWKGNENFITGARYTVLLFEVTADIEPKEKMGGLRIFGLVDLMVTEPLEQYFHNQYKQEIDRIKLAISLENERLETFEYIGSGTFSKNDDGEVVHHVGVSSTSNGIYIPDEYENDHLERIKRRIKVMPLTKNFIQIQNLLSIGLVPGADQRQSFLLIWNAFERLIVDCHAEIENSVLSESIPLQTFYNQKIKKTCLKNE